jgi:hypothetical protein
MIIACGAFFLVPPVLIVFQFMNTGRLEKAQMSALKEVADAMKLVATGKTFWEHEFRGILKHRGASLHQSVLATLQARQRLILALNGETPVRLMVSSKASSSFVLTTVPGFDASELGLAGLQINTFTPAASQRLMSQPKTREALLRLADRKKDLTHIVQVGPGGASLTITTAQAVEAEQIRAWFDDLLVLVRSAELLPPEPTPTSRIAGL